MQNIPLDTPDIEGAITLLSSQDIDVRQYVAYLLGETGDQRAIDPLIAALEDEHVGVRGAAANALGKLRDLRALPHLPPLLHDPNPQMVVWAAFALTMLGQDHFALLVGALDSPDVAVRRSAVLALHQLGDPRGIAPLLPLRYDQGRRFVTDTTVASAVAKALASLGYDSAL